MASIKVIRSNIATIDNAGDISLGDVTVSTAAPAAGTIVPDVDERTNGIVIPAGKLMVKVLNMGFVEDGDNEENITVNGDVIQPGSPAVEFVAQLDPVGDVFKFTPEVTIVNNNGSRIRIITQE